MTFEVTATYENGDELTLDEIGTVHHNTHKADRLSKTAIDITTASKVCNDGQIEESPIVALDGPTREDNVLGEDFEKVLYYPKDGQLREYGYLMITY